MPSVAPCRTGVWASRLSSRWPRPRLVLPHYLARGRRGRTVAVSGHFSCVEPGGSVRCTATCMACHGSAVVTGQSLPPCESGAAVQQPTERVLPAGPPLAQQRVDQLVGLLVVGRPQRLDIGRHSQLGEAADVGVVDQLHMGDVVAPVAGPVRADGGFDRVQALAHRAVTDRVEVHLEADGVQPGHRLDEQLGRHSWCDRGCRWRTRRSPGTAPGARRYRDVDQLSPDPVEMAVLPRGWACCSLLLLVKVPCLSQRPQFDPAHPLGCHRRRISGRSVFDKLLQVLRCPD